MYKNYSCFINISEPKEKELLIGDEVKRNPVKYHNVRGPEVSFDEVGVIKSQFEKSKIVMVQWEGNQNIVPVHKDNLKLI